MPETSPELTAQLLIALVTLLGVITAAVRQEMAKRSIEDAKSNTSQFQISLKRLLEENTELRKAKQSLLLECDALRDIVRYVRSDSACKEVVDAFIERRKQQKGQNSNEH